MNEEDREIVEALCKASKQAGFEFTSPYVVPDSNGITYEYLGLLHQIGSSEGTLICSSNICPEGNDKESNYSLSIISPFSVSTSNDIKEMLLDLGWYGEEGRAPNVFNGS